MPKDSPGQIAKLQLNNMGYSGQASALPQNFTLDLRHKISCIEYGRLPLISIFSPGWHPAQNLQPELPE